MHRYHFGTLELRSEIALPELCEINEGSRSVTGQIAISAGTPEITADFVATHVDDRVEYAMMVDAESGEVTMRHENAVDFVISPGRDEVMVCRSPSMEPSTMRHYLLDQVLPRLLEDRGAFVLHASGVESDVGGMLFLGDSGSGKSSLGAEFERTGSRLIGDDCFVVEITHDTISAATTYPSLRLLPDAISEFLEPNSFTLSEVGQNRSKRRVDQNRAVHPAPGVIDAIFVIDLAPDHSGPPEAVRLPARHGMLRLVANSFRFHNTGLAAQRTLGQAEEILSHVPIYDLRYERRYDRFSEVLELVRTTVQRPFDRS